MAKNHIITALDIGTSGIKLLVVSKNQDDSGLQIISQKAESSAGVRRGVVIEPDEVSKKIALLVQRTQEEIGQKISSAYINIGGSHIISQPAHGEIAVSRADQKISQEDKNNIEPYSDPYLEEPINNSTIEHKKLAENRHFYLDIALQEKPNSEQ